MGQEIVKAFKEVEDRLKAANVQGGLLEHVKLVTGPTIQTFGDGDFPVIIYEVLNGGFPEDAAFPNKARFKMTLSLTVMTAADNGYQTDGRAGINDYIEKIMDTIDGSDLTGAGNWGPVTPQYRVGGFEGDDLKYTYIIETEIQTLRYTRGTLQS